MGALGFNLDDWRGSIGNLGFLAKGSNLGIKDWLHSRLNLKIKITSAFNWEFRVPCHLHPSLNHHPSHLLDLHLHHLPKQQFQMLSLLSPPRIQSTKSKLITSGPASNSLFLFIPLLKSKKFQSNEGQWLVLLVSALRVKRWIDLVDWKYGMEFQWWIGLNGSGRRN